VEKEKESRKVKEGVKKTKRRKGKRIRGVKKEKKKREK
jgi:hypothetical protein